MIPPVAAVEILIVEDHPRHAELLRDELELEIPGAIVTHAGCVADARDTASGRTFDLVILDFRLPDGDGLEILREFRAAGRDEPIVFVTTSAAASTAVQAMKLGAADYVVKEEGYLAIVPFVVRDVLERSRLRRERAELERRLERAEQAAELHKLTAGIAHNLNNPLTTVRTFLELLPQRWDDDREFRTEYYDLVLRESQRIRELVGSMMRTVAVSEGETESPWSAGDLVREVERWFTASLGEKALRLDCCVDEGLPALHRGREAARQALIVLVDNALAFSPPGGTIALSARRASDAASPRVLLEVADGGPGVPVPERGRIFDPFFSTRTGGVGIGLFVARSLARAQGGSLEVADAEGGGALFSLALPIFG